MKNLFEQPLNLNRKSEISTENSNIERDLGGEIEKSAEVVLNNLEESNNNFVERSKNRLGVSERNSALKTEIEVIQEKYRKEKQKVKSGFLTKLKKLGKYAAGGIIALAFTTHFAQKEYPDYLDKSKDKEPKEIEWNELTKQEIEKLSHEYRLLIKQDSTFNTIPDSIFENRFVDFVTEYGPDIEIVHTGGEMSIGNQINEYVFQNILRQPEHRAHYGQGTLFYEGKDLKMNEDSTKWDAETTSLGSFVAEFSHHINKDWELQRSFAYSEDLVRKGFQQQKMYEDLYSVEYQAHSVTQTAIAKYLFPDDFDLNVDFVDLYNLEQEYYREFMKMRGYERSEDIEGLTFDLLMDKKTDNVKKDKIVIFQNLEKIRNTLDTLNVNSELKGDLFSIMIGNFPLENPTNNYQSVIEKNQGISEVLELKKLAFNNPENFAGLAESLEEKYSTDIDYTYSSITRKIFDDEMIEKMKKSIDSNYTDKLFKLYIYGLTKGIEGSGFGYKDANHYLVQWAYEEYESYLKSLEKIMKKEITSKIKNNEEISADFANTIDDVRNRLKANGTDRYLSYALEYYVKNDVYGLDDVVQRYDELPESSSEIKQIIFRLQAGLKHNKMPNLQRDFFNDGQSPLASTILNLK